MICCGWNSEGIGKKRGFEILEVLLVPHGGSHNDTIVVVNRKIAEVVELRGWLYQVVKTNQRGASYSKVLSYSKSTVTSPPILVN